jgi:hypothetical protein
MSYNREEARLLFQRQFGGGADFTKDEYGEYMHEHTRLLFYGFEKGYRQKHSIEHILAQLCDAVPAADPASPSSRGWNACRRSIFRSAGELLAKVTEHDGSS